MKSKSAFRAAVIVALCFQIVGIQLSYAENPSEPKRIVEFRMAGKATDYIREIYTSEFVTLQELRFLPAVKLEQRREIPFEISIVTPEDQIVPDLNKLSDFYNDGDVIENRAVNITVRSEIIQLTGKPLLSLSLDSKLHSGQIATEVIRESNERLQKIISGLLKNTTFAPQITRDKARKVVVLSDKDWLTNVIIASDGKVMLAGYAFNVKSVIRLGENLLDASVFSEIHMYNMTKNIYEKQPVWRFEISGMAGYNN